MTRARNFCASSTILGGCESSLHREHAVGDDDLPRLGVGALEQRLEVRHVVVPVALLLGEPQPDAVHQRGMVLPVGEDDVVAAEDGGHGGHVGLESGGAGERRLAVEELGQARLQLLVQGQRSVQQAAPRAGGPETTDGLERSLLHPRVTGEAEVVVGADHDHPAALDVDLGAPVRCLDGAEVRVEARCLGDLVVLECWALVEDVAHGRVPSFEGPRGARLGRGRTLYGPLTV
jgi:hypothetical protein